MAITFMKKEWLCFIFLLLIFTGICHISFAQPPTEKEDTFFLAKKKGLLGKLGKSIAINEPDKEPEKLENPFLKFKGKSIRAIVSMGFGSNIYDTTIEKNSFGIRIANAFHKNTRAEVIRRSLFFTQGTPLYPYLLADNERYLRQIEYIQDARISVMYVPGSLDSVDVTVITKDVFSIGGKLDISSSTRGRMEVKEENFNGSGNRVLVSGFYEKDRQPRMACSAELVQRNIEGSFINWTTGFINYGEAYNSGRMEAINFYSKLEKPLVTPYKPSTGAIEVNYYNSSNVYINDSVFKHDFKFQYYTLDGWFGYSLDSKRALYANREIRIHTFAAIRAFSQLFLTVPDGLSAYNYNYANYTGALASINIFKQVFYKTSFLYGFGRNEDVPEGFSASITTGILKKQTFTRPYSGIDVEITNFKNKGFHSNFTLRAGGFFYRKRFEDLDLLFNVEHFTRLKRTGVNWYQRFFVNAGISAQVNPALNAPLFLNSVYGLPYFNSGNINADQRYAVKTESVFYNTKKILGFRLAPFVFADLSALKPIHQGLEKTDLYSAFGGGIRTRNENLVFGTIELKGYYFPRRLGDMHLWKLELSSNIRFKYNSTFIKKPDFISAN
jgi:hypothetical protein